MVCPLHRWRFRLSDGRCTTVRGTPCTGSVARSAARRSGSRCESSPVERWVRIREARLRPAWEERQRCRPGRSPALAGEFRVSGEGRGEPGAGEQGEHGQDGGRQRSRRPGGPMGRLVGFVRRGGGLVGRHRGREDLGLVGWARPNAGGRAVGFVRRGRHPGGGDQIQQARDPAQRVRRRLPRRGGPGGVPRTPVRSASRRRLRSASRTRSSARSHVAWYRRSRSPASLASNSQLRAGSAPVAPGASPAAPPAGPLPRPPAPATPPDPPRRPPAILPQHAPAGRPTR